MASFFSWDNGATWSTKCKFLAFKLLFQRNPRFFYFTTLGFWNLTQKGKLNILKGQILMINTKGAGWLRHMCANMNLIPTWVQECMSVFLELGRWRWRFPAACWSVSIDKWVNSRLIQRPGLKRKWLCWPYTHMHTERIRYPYDHLYKDVRSPASLHSHSCLPSCSPLQSPEF